MGLTWQLPHGGCVWLRVHLHGKALPFWRWLHTKLVSTPFPYTLAMYRKTKSCEPALQPAPVSQGRGGAGFQLPEPNEAAGALRAGKAI